MKNEIYEKKIEYLENKNLVLTDEIKKMQFKINSYEKKL